MARAQKQYSGHTSMPYDNVDLRMVERLNLAYGDDFWDHVSGGHLYLHASKLTSSDVQRLTLRRSKRGPGGGHWSPGKVALLVGERPGNHPNWGVPFVSFINQGSARWLTQHLDDAGISETSLYWVNAFNEVGVSLSSKFLQQLQPKCIVALGKVAAHWCRAHHLSFADVVHPQYHKRFLSRYAYPLADILESSL